MHLTLTATSEERGQRLDAWLAAHAEGVTRSAAARLLENGGVTVNGEPAAKNYRLRGDETVAVVRPEAEETAVTAQDIPLDVVYEDADVIVVNKPAGLVVHADDNGTTDTLIARIQAYLFQYGRWNPDAEASFTPSLCNRIDRGTSGIVIAAKTAEALRVMNQKIRDREIHKSYLCVTCGHVRPKDGRIQNYILRHEAEHRVTVHDRPVPGARTAITQYHVLKETPELSLVECDLITGRTHQLRAQFAHMGRPLLGDSKYGTNEMNRKYHRKSQALCSHKLRFDFTTDAGALAYLNGKTFTAPRVEFMSLFD